MSYSLVHERLYAERQRLQLTLREAAKATGLSNSYLCQLEHGYSMPTIDKLQRLARAYGTTVGYLIGEQQDDKLAKALARLDAAIELLKGATWA